MNPIRKNYNAKVVSKENASGVGKRIRKNLEESYGFELAIIITLGIGLQQACH